MWRQCGIHPPFGAAASSQVVLGVWIGTLMQALQVHLMTGRREQYGKMFRMLCCK